MTKHGTCSNRQPYKLFQPSGKDWRSGNWIRLPHVLLDKYICAIRLNASNSSCIAGRHIKTRSEKTILIRSFEKLEGNEDSEFDVYLSSRVDDEWHEIQARVISCYEMPHKEFYITFGDVNSQDKCSREVEQAIAALQALVIQEESNESAKV